MTHISPARPGESGSVIIWIFVCVAMFAALSFAVADMMRGGGTGKNEELVNVYASDIMSYSDNIRRAIQVMRVDGVSVSELSFENSFISGYENPRCNDPECLVFNTAGGGVTYTIPDPKWLDITKDDEVYFNEWFVAADTCVPDVGTGDATCAASDTTNEDLTLFLTHIKRPICMEINKQLGIENPNNAPPQESGCPWSTAATNRYTGSFINGESIIAGTSFAGRQSGCFQIGVCAGYDADTYHYYQVLLPR
ncbi:MAG: hypothetical protein KKA05_06280 [Alphaproteobacteria bacterium]|nr:hypothetical protein [Alphaproteobacteria bacterium]MBU0858686.1 hypothetical protein [Alphaproteobacteria bacterium]